MKYTVIVQPAAESEMEDAYLYIREESPREAVKWLDALDGAIGTLEEMPRRCPLTPESEAFEREIRHLLLPPYRVIYTVQENTVHVLHVRHMRRESLKP